MMFRFYEAECIRGSWSVRELHRQISTLLFERTGLSTDKAALADLVRQATESDSPALAIRDPYVFEFLGIKSREVKEPWIPTGVSYPPCKLMLLRSPEQEA